MLSAGTRLSLAIGLSLGLSACSSDWIAAQLTRLPDRPAARQNAQLLPAAEPRASSEPQPVPSQNPVSIQVDGDVVIDQEQVESDINCPGVGNNCVIQNITQLPEASAQPSAAPELPASSGSPSPAATFRPVPTPSPTPSILPEPSFEPEPSPTPEPPPASGALGPVTVASFAQEGWQHEILRDGAYVGIVTPDSAGKLQLYRSQDSGQNFSPVSLNARLKGGFTIGTDPGGAWLIVWQSDDDRLYMLRSGNRGQSWSAPIRVLGSFAASWLASPRFVTVSGQTWLVFQAGHLGLTELYLTRFDATYSFSEPVRVTTDALQNEQPQIAVTTEGIYVAWQADGRLMLSASHDEGANFGAALPVDDGNEHVKPGYRLLSQGKRLYLAYSQWVRQNARTASYDVILARRLRDSAEFERSPISDLLDEAQIDPDLMIDKEGSLHALWNDNRINAGYGTLAYARSRDGGTSFEPSRLLSETGPYSHGRIAAYPADPEQLYLNTIYHNEANGVRDFHFYRLVP